MNIAEFLSPNDTISDSRAPDKARGGGVAIPHARIVGLKRAFGILARLRKPIDFNSVDGEPVDVVFLLLLPAATAGEQLNVLAAVARRLREGDVAREIRQAKDSTILHRVMTAQSQQ